MEINLTSIFDNFYYTRVFVLILLSFFTLLLSLRLDNTLTCSYWLIFTPLWIWKTAVLFGVIFGSITWFRLAERRFDPEVFIQYKSMILSFATNLVLLLFELIICEKLESRNTLPWSYCFLPLYLLSLVSVATFIWSIKYARSYEIELFFSANMLQFIFIALRLDSSITWSWTYVFAPTWIVMFFSLIALMYIFILTIILTCYRHVRIETRGNADLHNNNIATHINTAYLNVQTRWFKLAFYTVFYLSLLAFELLLVQKLDNEARDELINHLKSSFYDDREYNKFFLRQDQFQVNIDQLHKEIQNFKAHQTISFVTACLPLYLAYLSLIFLSFNSSYGNIWWFGLGRRNYCAAFLFLCPIFQTYGNININFEVFRNGASNSEENVDNDEQNSSAYQDLENSRLYSTLNNNEIDSDLVCRTGSPLNTSINNNVQEGLMKSSGKAKKAASLVVDCNLGNSRWQINTFIEMEKRQNMNNLIVLDFPD